MLPPRMQDTAPPRTENTPSGRHRRAARRTHWGLRIGVVLLVIAAGLGVGAVRYYDWCQGAAGPRQPDSFEVAEGASGSEIVHGLHRQDVVRCGLVSTWLLRRSGLEGDFRAGTFELTTNMTPDDAFEALTTPLEPVPTVRLTIPEGYRLTQIAGRVQEDLGIPSAQFLKALRREDWALPPYLPEDAVSAEGFLFPKTYEFVKADVSARLVAQTMLEQFEKEVEALPFDRVKELDVTPYELVIIASMIEEEAGVDRDRRLIAGVIYNRIEIGMALGIDATLLYDDPTPDGELSTLDLEFDSPYNTRINPGLPPTPIASPGGKSLRAALDPADTRFLYYVLCGADGHHKFGLTLDAHDRNVRECLG